MKPLPHYSWRKVSQGLGPTFKWSAQGHGPLVLTRTDQSLQTYSELLFGCLFVLSLLSVCVLEDPDESCDLDSVVSSLAMAYFLFRTSSGPPGCSLVLPVLNIPRSQFHLRADVLLLLREASIATETLVFRDEVDLAHLHGNRRLALTLVDHNILPSTDRDLEGAVVEVIDHHQLQRTTSFACPVTMEMVLSCATLVTERILSRAPEILDQQLALLLYGVMVVDCMNLSPVAGKVMVKDRKMVHLLQTQFPDLPQRDALHTALHTAKFDLSGFTTEQILLNNMKTVAGGNLKVAVSIVYMSLDINHALLDTRSPALCLSPASSPYKDVLAYHQGNTLASRRKVLPVLTHLLSDWWNRALGVEDHGNVEEDYGGRMMPPPPPMNSLVDGCPLDGSFNQEALLEKFSRMGGGEEDSTFSSLSANCVLR
uniref:Prune exopolyphosphatase 1 n=1 Tax=Seriola lalandi dorsalis TaxID=1841481 RepID=A0A3B4WT58_SERLL